jgi:hypothetical protein
MFRLTADARYIDVLERTLYNNFLATVSLGGDRFFYACPPSSDGDFAFNVGWMPSGYAGPYAAPSVTRKAWFACACCPPNVARWLEQVPGFAYATGEAGIYVNLYAAGSARVSWAGRTVALSQTTRYPWAGRVALRVEPAEPARFALYLRIPGWARDEAVPGGPAGQDPLYRFAGAGGREAAVAVNGEPVPVVVERGFLRLARRWAPGDVVDLDLPMPVRRVVAHPRVAADRGKVAVQRGPIVYCAEGVDHEGRALDLALPPDARLAADFQPNVLGGVAVLSGQGRRAGSGAAVPLTLVPYYGWSHRGPGEMAVWLNAG